MVQYY